ncbi:hypothetical protein F5Y17DRAFT_462764 [Xylariaceae sp. FL0594]|nr:hypothetical protein F5Y17DRAFT_462764 [Xylariaceae sp. FL0594]
MSKANLIRPIRQALLRPVAGQTRHALPGLVSRRAETTLTQVEGQPAKLLNELPETAEQGVRLPRAVQALYLQPLRRECEYGVPSCDLQLRSYSIPNLEFFCDFALRAAYFLNLPAFGPIPLPKITERWTVPRSPFIFKKSQENFERITRRRLIQIRDGHPETVQIWLAFLQKHAYYGIGMKANMWEYAPLDVGKTMDSEMESMQKAIDEKMQLLGPNKVLGTVEKVKELLESERFKHTLKGGHIATKSGANYNAASSGAHVPQTGPGLNNSEATPEMRPNPDPSNPGSQGLLESRELTHAVVFSGIQPTGIPHLGNYLGAMRQWKRLQDMAGSEDRLLFSIVDLHAITMPQNAEALRYRRREMLAALMAIGLDPKKSTLFYQSSVLQHTELHWILSCTASMGYLSRMTQYKSKLLAENKQANLEEAMSKKLKLGLFSYPVLQAADILVHRATHVPVGDDQKQHLEFARECVTNFNHTYNADILVEPETITTPFPRIMSLRDPLSKMSKSSANERSRILITSTAKDITRNIMGAVTDSENAVSYDPANRPGVSNLLEILAQCTPSPTSDPSLTPTTITPEEAARRLAGATLGDLKAACASAVVAELDGVREMYLDLLDRQCGKYLDDLEKEGAEEARRNAEETMRLVRDAVGFEPLR